jgi:hypothetical protein
MRDVQRNIREYLAASEREQYARVFAGLQKTVSFPQSSSCPNILPLAWVAFCHCQADGQR